MCQRFLTEREGDGTKPDRLLRGEVSWSGALGVPGSKRLTLPAVTVNAQRVRISPACRCGRRRSATARHVWPR